MSKTIIAEGKTTKEATENGLKQLNVSRSQVEVKVLESDDKRSFFSILAPRVVKVELTLKETVVKKEKEVARKPRREFIVSAEDMVKAKENVEKFLKEFEKSLPEETEIKVIEKDNKINVSINNGELGFLIGYRGETLYSMQNILTSVAGKGIESRVSVILDVSDYKAKREKTLEELADKVAKTVIKTAKPVKLEPMQAYERKIIHSKLQENENVETTSVGEEPNRRIVVSIKK